MQHVFFIYLFCFFSFINGNSQTVIAYYSGNGNDIERYPLNKVTHVIYSFSHLKGNRLHIGNRVDSAAIKRLVAVKKRYTGLKILLSLGGWGGCKTCSAVFSSEKGREDFSTSVADVTNYFRTDGIDIDWEFPAAIGYPGHPYSDNDRDNFTALIKNLRNKLGKAKEISFLAACFTPYLQQSIDWQKVMPFVDRVNLMTYDIIGSRNKFTGHHTNLYSTSWQKESADNAIRYLDSLHIARDKIAIGVAFYAREFVKVPGINHGLHQPGQFKRFVSMKQLRKDYTKANGYIAYWDTVASAPYLYNEKLKVYLTYDNEKSVAAKAAYVRQKGLNGIMFWELRLDIAKNGLLDQLYEHLR